MQNDYCDREGVGGRRGENVEFAIAMAPRLELLIEEARRMKVPVVFVRTEHDETTNSPAWLGRRGKDPHGTSPNERCQPGSWGAEFYRVDPLPHEPVVTKHRYSGFAGTNLNLVLRTLGRGSLLFAGVATNACVESTLRDGLFHDYHVTLVEDCCAASTREAHEGTVRNVRQLFGIVTTSSEIIDRWHSDGEVQEIPPSQ